MSPASYEDGLELLRAALQHPLPQADRAFAEALQSESIHEVVALLQKTLKLDPFYNRAFALLGVAQMLCGRLDDAWNVLTAGAGAFPNDPVMSMCLALCATLRGDALGRASAIEALQSLDPATGDGALAMCELIGEVRTLLTAEFFAPHSFEDLMPLVGRASALHAQLTRTSLDTVERGAQSAGVRFPPALSRSWGVLIQTVLPARLKQTDVPAAQVTALHQIALELREGLYCSIVARMMMDAREAELRQAGLELAWQAADMPSVLPVRARSLGAALLRERDALRADPTLRARHPNLQRIASAILELHGNGNRLHENEALLLVECAQQIGETPMARWIASSALRRWPENSWLRDAAYR